MGQQQGAKQPGDWGNYVRGGGGDMTAWMNANGYGQPGVAQPRQGADLGTPMQAAPGAAPNDWMTGTGGPRKSGDDTSYDPNTMVASNMRGTMDPTQQAEYQKRMQQAMMAASGGFQPMATSTYDRGGMSNNAKGPYAGMAYGGAQYQQAVKAANKRQRR